MVRYPKHTGAYALMCPSQIAKLGFVLGSVLGVGLSPLCHSNLMNQQKASITHETGFIYGKLGKPKNQEKPIYSSIYVSGFPKSKKKGFSLPKQKKGVSQGK